MAVVATGFFDGVHVGHRLVIETLVEAAAARGDESVIVTFWPHPRTVISTEDMSVRLLNSLDERQELLSSLGVDRIVTIPFTDEFSRMSAEDYIKGELIEKLGAKTILLGYDNRLGSNVLAPQQTARIAAQMGLEVIMTEKVSEIGIAVSSTKIRDALNRGDVELASKFLCYDYMLKGKVVHGNGLGRKIGWPTANLQVDEPLKILPLNGVYSSRVEVGGRVFYGMTNVGVRPTVSEETVPLVETHILDFDEDIYGSTIKVSFLKRIRDERKFSSLYELSAQLKEDLNFCKSLY